MNFGDDGFGGERAHSIVDVIAEEPDGPQTAPPPDVVRLSIDKDLIEERRGNISSMPEGLIDFLTLDELRDLVEFLHSPK